MPSSEVQYQATTTGPMEHEMEGVLRFSFAASICSTYSYISNSANLTPTMAYQGVDVETVVDNPQQSLQPSQQPPADQGRDRGDMSSQYL